MLPALIQTMVRHGFNGQEQIHCLITLRKTDPVGTVIDTGINTNILYPGNYNLVVHYSDSASFGQNYSGCDLIQPFTIGSPTPLISGAIVIDEQCFDESDGYIELNPSGSNPTYSVVWDTTTLFLEVQRLLCNSFYTTWRIHSYNN